MKSIICSVVLVALVSPALADEYWVEYNYSTQKCSIVETKSQKPAAGTSQGITVEHAENIIAPNDDAALDATHGANKPNTTTEDAVSNPVNVGASSTAPKTTSPGNNNLDPTATVIAWAGKKDVAGAAWYDAAKILPAMQSSEQVVTEMKAITAMWEIWARETAASEAARSNAAKALIGTVSESPQRAEMKMNLMRKCGLAH